MEEVDLLFIGAGPSNIAMAVAIEERGCRPDVEKIVMLEAGDAIAWHRGMMFPEAQSQVSFLKDLVTLRNPTSEFSFLNFLHKTGRLEDFVNLQTFFPYRREISAYLQWCVDLLRKVEIRYSSAVVSVKPLLNDDGEVTRWSVSCWNGRTYLADRVVYGAGRDANVPELFADIDSERVLHASRFLDKVGALDSASIRSVAVVGGAQSSAEVYQECLNRFPAAQVRLLMRSVGFSPYGGSKFTNEIYGNEYVDGFFDAPAATRQRLLEAMHGSNYAGVTPTMLESLFRFHYLQRLDNVDRARIHTSATILAFGNVDGRLVMKWSAGNDAQVHEEGFDLVVLGTGYKNEVPALIRPVLEVLGMADLVITRGYRANIACTPGVSLHLLGVNEATHGISDTLLSVVGSRAERVLEDIRADRQVAAQESDEKMLHLAA
jgi:L-ornithine N5-oxygenase